MVRSELDKFTVIAYDKYHELELTHVLGIEEDIQKMIKESKEAFPDIVVMLAKDHLNETQAWEVLKGMLEIVRTGKTDKIHLEYSDDAQS